MTKPELLAPAGDWKSFIAAVEAGADAVYFGGKDFSARNLAVNLTREEIKKAIDYAHLRGVKCYAAVNILVKDSEFAGLFDYINFLYAEGIDALIVQDLGVFNIARKYWPDLPLHASTQMSAHNLNDILVLGKMGFKRAVLARELTIKEICDIKSKLQSASTADSPKRRGIEIKCFVHGALCFSYSGQCFLSSMIGGRSGNRGRCAQPCRKKYALVDSKTSESLNTEGYLLSTKDLCALDILDKIQFVDSLKIEGRMKGAAYVGGVLEKYRKAVNSLARNEKIVPEELEADKKELAGIFNRGGFSHGYLLDKKPKDLISPERSKNFGVLAGLVIEARRGAIKIRTKDVGVNDGLEIWGREGQEKNIGFRVEKMSGDIINIFIEGDIRVGDKVYKNFDYKLNKKLEALAEENYQKKTPARMIFRAKEGKNISLEINGVKTEGEKAESAIKIETSEDAARKQLSKLGATPFFVEKIDVEIVGKVYIPLKNLNNLRRDGAQKLEKKIINSFKREKKETPNLLSLRGIRPLAETKQPITEIRDCRAPNTGLAMTDKAVNAGRRIAIQSNDSAVLDELANKKISRIYTALKINVEKFHKNNIEVYQALPRIFREGEKIEIFADYDGFLVPALGYLRILPEKAKKIGDFSMNIFNNYSVREMKDLGFSGFTASVESTLSEINDLNCEKMEKEAVVYGYLPLMIAEHCVLRGTSFCGERKCRITDEKKINFPIFTDCANCRMQILNSVPLYFTGINNLDADNIRIIQTIEGSGKFLKIVENYLSGNFGFTENTTTGHFNRGVE
ncbi:MAG: U32 family peptidase [bacterium]|nr:U32 family peptidase [bacterium]